MKYDGELLKHASARLQDDADFVMKAVKDDGRALHYASVRLKDNNEIVLTASQRLLFPCKWASDGLINDASFVAQAIASYAPQNLHGDEYELAPHNIRKTFKDCFRGMDKPLVSALEVVQCAANQQGVGMQSFLEQQGSYGAVRCVQLVTPILYERIWLLGQVAGPIPAPVIKLINDFSESDLTKDFAKVDDLIRLAPVLAALEGKGLTWTETYQSLIPTDSSPSSEDDNESEDNDSGW